MTMAEVKHTPGPWSAHKTIEAHDGMPECWQIDAEHDAVCTTQFCYAPNTEANARLIAAAPDLFEAVWALVEHFERVDGDAEHKAVIAKACAALSKATAQQEGR